MLNRILVTIVLFFIFGWFEFYAITGGGLLSSEIAGHQFDNSDVSYLMTQSLMRALSLFPFLVTAVFILLLIGIWITPIRTALRWLKQESLLIFLALPSLLLPTPSRAYYQQQNWPEIYFIYPNESAFWIPDNGANKDTQAQFGSEAYYKDNKIAAKRFNIPHEQLPSSSYWKNYYVPSGRLIVVDRTPVARIWVAGSRGTNNTKDEHFPCQSKEGIDASVGISIGASVTEESAPRFLYRFGVHAPEGDRTNPDIVFTSVYRGYSLAEVMDQRIHPKVQALVCDQLTMFTVDEINEKLSSDIMPNIERSVKEYLANDGVTLDFIGWADTVSFPQGVQDSINRRFIADKEAKIAEALAPVTKTLQEVANAEATRAMANKWNGQMPSSLSVFGTELQGILGTILANPPVKK